MTSDSRLFVREGDRNTCGARNFTNGFKLTSKYSILSVCFIFCLNLIICDCNHNRENAIPLVSKNEVIDVSMPGVRPTQDDHYLCTSVNIEAYGTQYIQAFEPNSNADRAHHMILFTCDDVSESLLQSGWWDCGHHYSGCRNQRIIYAWAKNAPPTILPDEVGFRIGAESNIKNLVLQVHYAHPMPEGTKDTSGFRVLISPEEPKYLAGIMLLFRSNLEIPPKTEKIHGDMNCRLDSPAPIHPFAYRVHTHKLGLVVSGYKIDQTTGIFEEIGKGNPQWPQAFYPIKKNITINSLDYLAAQCTFTTKDFDKPTKIGQTAGDEMCNLYIMFYTASRDPEDHYITCMDEILPAITEHLPLDSDVPLPRNKTLEEHAKGHHPIDATASSNPKKSHTKKRPGITETDNQLESGDYMDDQQVIQSEDRQGNERQLPDSDYKVVTTWPDPSVKIGQASGVDFDTAGNVVVFHRGDRVWDHDTFDNHNIYRHQESPPIESDTVLIIHPTSGKILHQWGSNMFYMPHDITVDNRGNFWLTDVALHQVFKFSPGSTSASMVLGTKFEPGNDDRHFCKPAAVAVMSTGDFFVADGYCNSRIVKFNSRGEKILQWGRPFQPNIFSAVQSLINRGPPPYAFQVPHALALAENKNLICVADRENGRIQCFNTFNGTYEFMVDSPAFGGRLFSVAYSGNNGGYLFAVNGPNPSPYSRRTVQGFVIPLSTKKIASVFKPTTGFGNPHDVAVTNDGSDVYVVEISKPYKVWKFSKSTTSRTGKGELLNSQTEPISTVVDSKNTMGPKEPVQQVQTSHLKEEPASIKLDKPVDDSFEASVIIMSFLTIPLLLLIGFGAIMKLRATGCFRRKETKSFAEFFPPSAGFEKLRMDESESDNSDTEVEEFAVSSYRKTSA